MINSKNMLKKKLKENRNSLIFETIYNEHKPELIGIKRKVNIVQSNAFTLLTEKDGKIIDSWVYFDSKTVQVKNNILMYLYNDKPFIKIKIIEENWIKEMEES